MGLAGKIASKIKMRGHKIKSNFLYLTSIIRTARGAMKDKVEDKDVNNFIDTAYKTLINDIE